MKALKQIIFILIMYLSFMANAQDISIVTPSKYTSVDDIVKGFMKQHYLQFSYDVKRMEQSYIQTPLEILSFNSFKNNLKSIHIELEEESIGNYLLIQTDITITYCAIVKEKNTNLEIPDVLITQGDSYVGSTDLSGQINLDLLPGTLLTFSNTGYLSQKIVTTKKDECDILFLENNVRELEEVILTNYLTRGIVKNKNSSLTISPKALAILPGLVEPDIFQSLQLIPGISSPEEDPGALHIRGGTPDQNLILWDGIKIYQNSHFFNQISSFNPYITKKVDVYRGGTSVRYGDRISGVIDIQSDDDLFNTFKGGFGVNLLAGDAYLKIPISKKLGLLVAGRRSLTDLYESFTFNSLSSKVFQNSRLENIVGETSNNDKIGLNYFFSDVNVKLKYQPNDAHSYTLSFISIANELKNTNSSTLEENSLSIVDSLKQTNIGASFTWQRQKEKKTTKQFQLYMSRYSSDYLFEAKTPNTAITAINSGRKNFIIEFGYDLFYDIPFGEKHHVLLGHQATITSVENFSEDVFTNNTGEDVLEGLGFSLNSATKSALVGYSEYRYDSKKLLLSAGIRVDYNNLLRNAIVEPRIYSTLKINDALRLTGSLEQKNQSFSQYSSPEIKVPRFDLLPSVGKFWSNQLYAGQPYIIQKSGQFTLGALYNKKGWSLELEGYFKRINNTIPINDTFLTSIYTIEEREQLTTGNARRFGLDLLIKKRIRDYRIWMSYSFGKNNVKYDDLQSNYFPEAFDQRHRFNLSQTYKYNQFEFALGWTYGSGLPFTETTNASIEDIANIKENNLVYNKRLPDYHRLDLSSVYHFKNAGRWNGKLGLSIRNLYNRKQFLQQTYALILDDNNEDFLINSNSKRTLGFTADVVFRISF